MGDVWLRVKLTFPETEFEYACERFPALVAFVQDGPEATDFECYVDRAARTFVLIERFPSPEAIIAHAARATPVGRDILQRAETMEAELLGDVTEGVRALIPDAQAYLPLGVSPSAERP